MFGAMNGDLEQSTEGANVHKKIEALYYFCRVALKIFFIIYAIAWSPE
jgi:hypothetical protein